MPLKEYVTSIPSHTTLRIGMTRVKKIEARRPWLNSLIIKLVGEINWVSIFMATAARYVENAARTVADKSGERFLRC